MNLLEYHDNPIKNFYSKWLIISGLTLLIFNIVIYHHANQKKHLPQAPEKQSIPFQRFYQLIKTLDQIQPLNLRLESLNFSKSSLSLTGTSLNEKAIDYYADKISQINSMRLEDRTIETTPDGHKFKLLFQAR